MTTGRYYGRLFKESNMSNEEMREMLEILSDTMQEAQKFHEDFTDDKQLELISRDQCSKFFPITFGTLRTLVEYTLHTFTVRNRIDEKHHIAGNTIYKTSNNIPISDDEPRILFRGRDNLALPMLRFYRQLCVDAGCTEYQLQSMDRMCAEFEQFAYKSTTMKQPGITRGK